jgi:hypothetical protein
MHAPVNSSNDADLVESRTPVYRGMSGSNPFISVLPAILFYTQNNNKKNHAFFSFFLSLQKSFPFCRGSV